MPSLSFRISATEKDMIDKEIESYQKRNPQAANKNLAIVGIIEAFMKYQTEGTTDTNYVAPNVYDVLQLIECDYLKFMEQDFACYEQAHKKHAPQFLEGTPEQVQTICQLCLKGKRDLEIMRSKKLQEKEYIRRLATFAKGLIKITEKGIVHDVFFCLREILDGNLGFSRDNQTMFCPMQDGEIVYVDETCRTRINPKDGSPQCQYLSSMSNIVRLDKDFWKKSNLDLPELGLDLEPDEPDPEEIDKEQARKIIEAEVIEPEGKEIEPEAEEQPEGKEIEEQ